MQISLNFLNRHGQLTNNSCVTTWEHFICENDGFHPRQLSHMQSILEMGMGYLVGENPECMVRLKKIEEEVK